MLLDNNIYTKVKKHSAKCIISNFRKLLTIWKNSEYISNATHKAMISNDELLLRAYDFPKIIKLNCTFRIISSVDSPLYVLATFLQETISISIPISPSHNSFRFS